MTKHRRTQSYSPMRQMQDMTKTTMKLATVGMVSSVALASVNTAANILKKP